MTACQPSRPELLAPAGDWDALRAAVANGADAVYFGLSNFNARHRATNFTVEELPQVMDYLHRHNVRGYVAFNTLIFSDELPEAVQFITAIVTAGADAVIVQDLGLVRLIRSVAPGLAIHGSTQMTLTEPRGIELVRRLGVERVIVARELSIDDIGRIAQCTPMPLEVFVHGALCVAYSGQCLTSEALGGRSANRGQCAQACRLPYDLVVDGRPRDTGDRNYLLSPQDLSAHDLIEPLVKLGVRNFKIEGRLKSAEYVAITSQTYRAAIDAALAVQPFELDRQRQLDLQQSFSRGFSHGFLGGINHQVLVPGRFPKSRGVRIGTVAEKTPQGVIVELEAAHVHSDTDILRPGDGVVFDEGHPEQDEQGGRVVQVRALDRDKMRNGECGMGNGRKRISSSHSPFPNPHSPLNSSQRLELMLYRGSVNLAAISIGSIVWKTDDPAMRRRMEQSFSRDVVVHRQPLYFTLSGAINGSLILECRDSAGNIGSAAWPGPLQVARNQPWTNELLVAQLSRLGDTPFELGDLTANVPAEAIIPKSVLNDLRRQAVAEIIQAREHRNDRTIHQDSLNELRRTIQEKSKYRIETSDAACDHNQPQSSHCVKANLYVLVRTMPQLEAVLDWRRQTRLSQSPLAAPIESLAMVYCDFEDVRRYADAVAKARHAGVRIAVATLRIIKPNEEGLLRVIAKADPDAVLVRNLAAVDFFREEAIARLSNDSSRKPLTESKKHFDLIGDFSLNVANELTADLLLAKGLDRLAPSYDLNWEQLAAMLGRIDPAMFEVVVHQHMPMFHMEHCVFAAMLSNGKDATDCGRPCDRHRVELRDRVGAAFPLLADTGCRNTVFNSVAQSAAEYIPKMLELGVRHFRMELLRETPEQVGSLLSHYSQVIAGLESPRQAWRNLQIINRLGVTRGTLQLA